MKNKVAIIVTICLVLVLVASVFVACDNKENENTKATQRRQNAISSVEEAFVCGIDENWAVSLANEDIATLDNAGEYIVTLGWTSFVCQAIDRSSIQTSKIEALATYLLSNDGKAVLADFEDNAELLIPMLKDVGFTPNDVNSLLVELLNGLIADSASAMNGMIERLNAVKDLARQNQTAFDNINQNISTINFAKANFVPDEQEKADMLVALEGAEHALNAIVAFAYDMSINALTDELFEGIFANDGALNDISNSEIVTFVNTLIMNVENLKNELVPSEVEKLNVALNLIIEKFDNNAISSPIYAQIIKYAKYAYMVVDVIPSVCDIVIAGGDILSDVSFLDDAKSAIELNDSLNAGANAVNLSIMIARIVENVLQDFDEDSLCQLIDQIGAQGVEEYQKAYPIMMFDLMLNSSDIIDGMQVGELQVAHDDLMDEKTMQIMLSTVLFFNSNIDKFKNDYEKYQNGEIALSQLSQSASLCGFGDFGVTNPYSVTMQTDLWFEHYMNIGIATVNQEIAKCMPTIIDDLKAFANDYYQENSQMANALIEVARLEIVNEDIEQEEFDSIYEMLKQCCLYGIVLFVQ